MSNQTLTNQKAEELKRKGLVALDIAVSGAMRQMAHDGTIKWSAGIGLWQGLKYGGNFKRGLKAGIATYGVFAAVNAVSNVAGNWDKIKKS